MAFRGGRGRGRGRGGASVSRPARSGIRTRGGGYKKFDSQRTREIERRSEESEESPSEADVASSEGDNVSEPETDHQNGSYAALLDSLKPDDIDISPRPAKRRRMEEASSSEEEPEAINGSQTSESDEADQSNDAASQSSLSSDSDESEDEGSDDNTELSAGAYDQHLSDWTGPSTLSSSTYNRDHETYKSKTGSSLTSGTMANPTRSQIKAFASISVHKDLPVKPRLQTSIGHDQADIDDDLASYMLGYADMLITNRTPSNAAALRKTASLHAVNHILTGRDRVIKNNARLAQAGEESMLELRDQGFTRPKVLILTETRQMCAKYADCIVSLFQPDQQENKQRFLDSFREEIAGTDMPEDHQELFEGNNDNNFLTTIKFTRKTMKFFSAFYQSDIILASPLGLRRVLEHEDKKKRDHDFLSSIEVLIIDQADAMQMQSWENIELVFRHLNLQPKELRDCDVNRVHNWYLDGLAKHYRQTIIFSQYLTPEMNRLFNSELQNVAGKIKITEQHVGAIQAATGMGFKQIFSRFPSQSPQQDPDARFKFFTSSILPSLLRIPQPTEGGQGILIFIPSYFDFLRVRNFFATSTMTENVSFGAIHDYSEASEQRRARSHFLSGKHSILLYTQRAHHFFRLRLRGVKRAIMYALPDNPIFYSELVAGFIGTSLEQGVGSGECFSRSIFSKFDALSLERVVGTARVKSMLTGTGDTFEFV